MHAKKKGRRLWRDPPARARASPPVTPLLRVIRRRSTRTRTSHPRWRRGLRLSCRRPRRIPPWWQWASRVISNRLVFLSVPRRVASWIHVDRRPTKPSQCSRRRRTTEGHAIDRWHRRSDIVDSRASSGRRGWTDYRHRDSPSSRSHLAPRNLITHVTTQESGTRSLSSICYDVLYIRFRDSTTRSSTKHRCFFTFRLLTMVPEDFSSRVPSGFDSVWLFFRIESKLQRRSSFLGSFLFFGRSFFDIGFFFFFFFLFFNV